MRKNQLDSKGRIKTKILDKLWAQCIKARDQACIYCGSTTSQLHAHHIFSRSNYALRWDLNNGVTLCAKHHTLGKMSAHKAPMEFAEFLREKLGEEHINSLRYNARDLIKADRVYREDVYNRLLAEYENLKA